MRTYLVLTMSALLCCAIVAVGTAKAAEAAKTAEPEAVPATLDKVSNKDLQQALREYAPNYDEMGRGSQVFAFVQVYKWVNGKDPELASEDAALLETNQPVPVQQHPSEWLDVESVYLSTPAQPVNAVIRGVDWFDNPVLDTDKK